MPSYHIFSATTAQVPYLYQNFIIPYFPAKEVKPLKNILRMMDTKLYRVLCITSDQRNFPLKNNESNVEGVAFLTTCPDADFYLLDYLAVHSTARSKGLGSLLLNECGRFTDGLPVIIETESIETAKNDLQRCQRINRNRFYTKNGAQPTGIRSCIFDTTYDNWILSQTPSELTQEELRDRLRKLYHFMVPNINLYEKSIKIPY